MYKEPFLLPTENLIVGLGDTRKLSVSNGLEETAAARVSLVPGGHSSPSRARGPKGRWRPCPGSQAKPRDSRSIFSTFFAVSQTPTTLWALSQMARGSDWSPLR